MKKLVTVGVIAALMQACRVEHVTISDVVGNWTQMGTALRTMHRAIVQASR